MAKSEPSKEAVFSRETDVCHLEVEMSASKWSLSSPGFIPKLDLATLFPYPLLIAKGDSVT